VADNFSREKCSRDHSQPEENWKNFIVEKTIAPLREGSGKIAHFISTDRDITERCRPETQLQQAGEI
jgi:hypothetical protein